MYFNIVGELLKGLGVYFYVNCLNVECGQVNLVLYGKIYKKSVRNQELICIFINIKLGIGM